MRDKKKILIQTVFDETRKILPRGSKSSIASYLSSRFEETQGFPKDERTFVRYYTRLVDENLDYDIDDIMLDWLSSYIGHKDYNDFCNNFSFTKKINESTTLKFSIDDEEHSFSGKKGSTFHISLFNKSIFNLPEYLTKQSSLSIVGALICAGLVGSKLYNNDKKESSEKSVSADHKLMFNDAPSLEEKSDVKTVIYLPQTFGDFSVKKDENMSRLEKQCMYWNGKEYIPEDCHGNKNNLIAIDLKMVENFKKITKPDTIKSINNIWYSKYKNIVEFFTEDGMNPENGKDLRPVTKYILEKYGNAE